MSVGKNIKKFRSIKGLTQKDLAEKLNVTPQAVSRWELDLVEPGLETIKEMASLFEVSLEQMMSDDSIEEKASIVQKNDIAEQVKQALPIIGICQTCGKTVKLGEGNIFTGAHSAQYCKCNSCLEKEAKEAQEKRARKIKNIKRRSWILAPIIAVIVALIVGWGASVSEPVGLAVTYGILSGVLTFLTLVCVFTKNNFIGEMWFDICEWGFVNMPGLIFSLDLDGIVWFLTVKLLLWLLGILLAIGAAILATVIAAFLSVFVFPFAVYWLYKKPEKCDLN